MEEEEEKEAKLASSQLRIRTQSRVGPPSPVHSLFAADGVENRVPNVCFDVGPHVFVEAFTVSGAVAAYFESFANL